MKTYTLLYAIDNPNLYMRNLEQSKVKLFPGVCGSRTRTQVQVGPAASYMV